MKDQEPVKILFITQEIDPYIKETEIADICRKFPQYTQEKVAKFARLCLVLDT